MTKWKLPTRNATSGGRFQILIGKSGLKHQDVSYFRGVPTSLDSYASADPFGDATAVITFPQVTPFDDPQGAEFHHWFGVFANVDIWWIEAVKTNAHQWLTTPGSTWIDPITQQSDLYCDATYWYINSQGNPTFLDKRTKVFEGWVTSIEYTSDDSGQQAQFQCAGALFQLDRYLQKPYYPNRPQPFETIIREAVAPRHKPHLRTKPLRIQWPAGWSTVIPKRKKGEDIVLVVDGKPGDNWTGYAARDTGSWDRVLTEYIQNQLAMMITKPGCGITPGQQWTMMQVLETTNHAGREPVLQVRYNTRAPDITVWIGTPGVTADFTRDSTQMANIVYGDGQSLDGTTWNGANISQNGAYTSWNPIAWLPDVWPIEHNKQFNQHVFVSEAYQKFDVGINQDQAQTASAVIMRRDLDPGYTGDLTLAVDPEQMSRWLIRAGMTVKILGLVGTGRDGVNFHITQVQANPADGTVELTLDSKYRDFLTVQEARARTRDPLTPTIMMNPARMSQQIQDIQWPWSYAKGSGYVKPQSKHWWTTKPPSVLFPYQSHFHKYPPKHHRDLYVEVKANHGKQHTRFNWKCVPVITAARGTIRRIEAICVNYHGDIIPVPFHLSIYYVRVHPDGMPQDPTTGQPTAFALDAFTTVDPNTGQPWDKTLNQHAPQPTLVDGALWGTVYEINNKVVKDRAGFYPGSEAAGSPASGLLVDNTPWSFDNTQQTNVNWNPNQKHGWHYWASHHHAIEDIELYAMFYAEWHEPVYFMARLWEQSQGSSQS